MKQDSAEKNIFHFKMDSEMKNELKELDLFKQAGSFSQLVVNILSILIPLMEKKHFSGKQKGSKYEFINKDPEVMRESIFVYMPEWLYRQLKLMHQDLNWYSIAQLLRRFLRFFLDLVERFGDGFQKELDNLMGRCNADVEEFRFSHQVVLQLLQFIHQKSPKIRLFTIYNCSFTPMKIFCL